MSRRQPPSSSTIPHPIITCHRLSPQHAVPRRQSDTEQAPQHAVHLNICRRIHLYICSTQSEGVLTSATVCSIMLHCAPTTLSKTLSTTLCSIMLHYAPLCSIMLHYAPTTLSTTLCSLMLHCAPSCSIMRPRHESARAGSYAGATHVRVSSR